ncbi:MAG: type transport system permease protein [Solirubrobacteraceae bacterium]|jgi:ABC-2 type transport system permease protein|nr:type transport system permease protein [Solirubrobacteraceae bacterium]MEA2181071.1 type transport system permease protein [Solirubrobacteraceae bacterium]
MSTATPTFAQDLRLAGWQVRHQQRSFWRDRRAAFFALIFPLMFLVLFGGLQSGTHLDVREHLSFIDFYTPGIMAYSVLLICFTSTAMLFASMRTNGILKRVRTTPLPWLAYVAGTVGSTFVVLVASIVLLFAAAVPLFGAHVPGEKMIGLLATLILGAAAFTTLGIAAARLIKKPENGGALISVVTLPMVFISNIFYPMDGAPAWLQDIAKALPLRPLADGLQAAFDPRFGGTGILWRDLLPLAIWTLVGCALMSRYLTSLARRD